jgi:hypothetical protein
MPYDSQARFQDWVYIAVGGARLQVCIEGRLKETVEGHGFSRAENALLEDGL